MSNIVQYDQIKSMALDIAKSGFFAAANSEAKAITLMLIAQADNIHPMRALMEYDVIGGKPALKSTTILSRFQQSGGKVKWLHTDDKKAVAEFSHPQGGEITIEWTIERAQKADLLKNDTWKKYPNQMLRARCIPEGVRAIYPAVLSGMYSTDEVTDFTVETKEIPTFEDADIVESPEINLTNEKRRLQTKLKQFNFTIQDIKDFATHFNIGEDAEAIKALNDDNDLLTQKVNEFDKLIKGE